MLSVPSLRLNQFGVNFYEALLSGVDLQSLVGFEVLSFGPAAQTTRGHARQTTSGRVNWELLEKRIAASEHAYQRPIIRKKIDEVVELFVTINSKHTKLNPSHLISLSGRRLYRDENLAAAHDVIRTLNEDDGSPLRGQIKVLGIGRGSVTQASLADELRDVFAAMD